MVNRELCAPRSQTHAHKLKMHTNAHTHTPVELDEQGMVGFGGLFHQLLVPHVVAHACKRGRERHRYCWHPLIGRCLLVRALGWMREVQVVEAAAC